MSLIEAYNIVERKVKLSNKTLFFTVFVDNIVERKVKLSNKTLFFIVFADNIGLINYLEYLVRFEHILYFSKIEDSITT